jgi:ubiquinone/menaquinone biosynthesis C-methylase UbiE
MRSARSRKDKIEGTMVKTERAFLPAAGRDLFLPLYDPLTKILGVDTARRTLLDQAELRSGYHVLDVGCGTGTLAVLIKRLYPTVDVVGLDPDPKALARAERKAARAGAPVQFIRGFADGIHVPDATFDRVFSSMMFHHLQGDHKEQAMREMRRVLKSGGRLEFLDFAGPQSHGHGGALARLFHSHHTLADNSDDRLLKLMTGAGFASAIQVSARTTLFGRIGFYQALAR